MYYYLTESLTTKNERDTVEKIQQILSQLGISGEFAVASPARTVEEQLELAIRKGFTTVVGIGSDSLANQIASTLLRFDSQRIVMGMIPLSHHQKLWSMTGASSTRGICESLRERLTIAIDAVTLGQKQAFITEAHITLDKPVSFSIGYDQVHLKGQLTHLQISQENEVQLWRQTSSDQSPQTVRSKGLWQRLFQSSIVNTPFVTRFKAEHWTLATSQPCQIIVEDQISTQTPLSVSYQPKALKLIVNRARISPDKETVS